MSDERIIFSFVKTMPEFAPIYKERLYDYMVGQGLDPGDETIFPTPTYLTINIHPLGCDDPLCARCVEEFLADRIDGDYDLYHCTKQGLVYDTPISCTLCDRKLRATIKSKESAEAIIQWTVNTLKNDKELNRGDWYDLWSSLEFLEYDDDLWDFIGFILVQCGNL